MIATILAFGAKLPWKWIGIALAVLGLLGGVYAKGRADDAKHWKPLLAAAQSDLTLCQANRVTLQSAIDKQNTSLTALAAEGQARTAAADKAVQTAQAAVDKAAKTSAGVMAATPGADLCKSAFDVLKGKAG